MRPRPPVFSLPAVDGSSSPGLANLRSSLRCPPSRTPTDGFRHAAATNRTAGRRYVLLGLILLAAAVRFGTLGAKGFWGDELSTVDLVHRSLCSHADGNRESRIHPPALLPGLVALGEGVPQHRGRNPRGSSDLRCRPRACRLLDRARARERACRHDHCRAGRGQPIPRLVLAGGSLVFATDTAQRDRAAAHSASSCAGRADASTQAGRSPPPWRSRRTISRRFWCCPRP